MCRQCRSVFCSLDEVVLLICNAQVYVYHLSLCEHDANLSHYAQVILNGLSFVFNEQTHSMLGE